MKKLSFIVICVFLFNTFNPMLVQATENRAQQWLPANYFASWCYMSSKGPGPFFWKRVLIGQNLITLVRGEESKDSGMEKVVGIYSVLSGKGSEADTFRIIIDVDNAITDQSFSYPQAQFKKGDKLEGSVWISAKNELHIKIDKWGDAILLNIEKDTVCNQRVPILAYEGM